MAKTSGPLFSADASGPLGACLGFVRHAGSTVVRSIAKIRADAVAGRKRPPTAAQLLVRNRWMQGVDSWNDLTPEAQAQWALNADRQGLTGFNLFMQHFTPSVGVAWDGGASTWDDGSTIWTE